MALVDAGLLGHCPLVFVLLTYPYPADLVSLPFFTLSVSLSVCPRVCLSAGEGRWEFSQREINGSIDPLPDRHAHATALMHCTPHPQSPLVGFSKMTL